MCSKRLPTTRPWTTLWRRGGFPDSFLAANDADSLAYRQHFIATYLERDIPQLSPRRTPAATLERLWRMLAHGQGALLNASALAASLSISAPTVTRYVDLLADLLLVRRLPPCLANTRKRLTKAPRVYVRDSGLVHALLGLEDDHALAGHPVMGASWEGFVIENLLAVAPSRTAASFYRTAAGAEIDLVLELPGRSATLGGRGQTEPVAAPRQGLPPCPRRPAAGARVRGVRGNRPLSDVRRGGGGRAPGDGGAGQHVSGGHGSPGGVTSSGERAGW